MQYVKDIDPVEVAKLEQAKYDKLFGAAEIINNGVREVDFPTDLCSFTFLAMRECGMKDLRNWDGMKVGAMQLRSMHLLVQRLRAASITHR